MVEANRRNFIAGLGSAALAATAWGNTRADSTAVLPKVIFFDVNETLLDLKPLEESVGQALGGRPDLVQHWFTTMLQYSLVHTVSDQYRDFGEIGGACLAMIAKNHGFELGPEVAMNAVAPIRFLPAHSDVPPALKRLREDGYRLITLTNSSSTVAKDQLQNAGLDELFDARFSVEDLGLFKPHAHVYRWAARRAGVKPSDCMLVAAHGWDVAGASWAGMKTAFVARPEQQVYPLGSTPDFIVPSLKELPDEMANRI